MAYEALYTRARPKKLSHLVGQTHISLPLTRAINQSRLSHAYLLVGTRGTGKTSTARLLAKAANCETVATKIANGEQLAPNEIPCGKCDSCINFDSSPDNVEFDAASNRSVEDISRVLSTVYLAPLQSRVKTYIIDEVHMLSFEAVNSILKLIEEPPDNVIFFLATTEYNKVPMTIRSRCQILNFKLIAADEISKHILQFGPRLGINIDPNAAMKIARLARGSMRDALTLLDQCYSMIDDKNLTVKLVDETLGLVADADLDALIDAVLKNNRSLISQLVTQVFRSGITAQSFAESLITRCRDLVIPLNNLRAADIVFFDSMIECLRKAVVEMQSSGIADIILETTLLKFASTRSSAPATSTFVPPQIKTASTPPKQPTSVPTPPMPEGAIDGDELIKRMLDHFEAQPRGAVVVSNIQSSKMMTFKDDTLTFHFDSDITAQMFKSNAMSQVKEALHEITNKDIKVAVVCSEPVSNGAPKNSFDAILATLNGKARINLLKAKEVFDPIKIEVIE